MYLIYLLRRDLRLSDNVVFHALKQQKRFTHVLPIYIFPPHQIEVSGFLSPGSECPYPEARSRVGKFWRCGPRRAKFLAEGIWDLKTGLQRLDSDLILRVGRMDEVVRQLLASPGFQDKVGAVWITKDWASEEVDEELSIQAAVECEGQGKIEWKVWDGEEMLIHDDDLPTKPSLVQDVFTSFRKQVEPLRDHVRPTLSPPSSLPPLPVAIPAQMEPFIIPDTLNGLIQGLQAPLKDLGLAFPIEHPANAKSAHPFTGGEPAAQLRVCHLLTSGAMSAYKDTRNGMLGEDFSTKLAGYFANGFISARQVHAYLMSFEDGSSPPAYLSQPDSLASVAGFGKGENKGTAAVRFELLWRDYMRLCMRKYGKGLFALSGFHGQQQKMSAKEQSSYESSWLSLPSARDAFQRFQNGTTGTGLIDASMRELYLTGYTSNRARQNCASFLAKWLGIDWRLGAEWYECLLVDYDVASNWGNWQYVAGVGNDPRDAGEGGRKFNPVKQGWDYDSKGEYVKTWVEELRNVRNIDVVLQGWKAGEVLGRTRGNLGEDERQALQKLKAVMWAQNPLVKIKYDRNRSHGNAHKGKDRMRGKRRSHAEQQEQY